MTSVPLDEFHVKMPWMRCTWWQNMYLCVCVCVCVCVRPCVTEGWAGGREETGESEVSNVVMPVSCKRHLCEIETCFCQEFDHWITPLSALQLEQCIVKCTFGAEDDEKSLGVQKRLFGQVQVVPIWFHVIISNTALLLDYCWFFNWKKQFLVKVFCSLLWVCFHNNFRPVVDPACFWGAGVKKGFTRGTRWFTSTQKVVIHL